jgi:hypothetical protein
MAKLFTTVKVDLAAADASKTLIAAPSGGVTDPEKAGIRIHRIVYISKTSAAQALSVDIGTVNILDLAASVTAHTVIDTGFMDGGIRGQVETALVATPAAAGPAGSFYVTYSID